MKKIDKLIINSPYEEPQQYWEYIRDTREFILQEGRRPAGYVVATPQAQGFDDPGLFIEIDLVNKIRPRIKKWREQGYPGVTGITKRLLQHWQDPEERKDRRFFFCQLEAIETLIWLTEAPEADRTGIDIQRRWWRFFTMVHQDGHRLRQNHCHGYAPCMASPE